MIVWNSDMFHVDVDIWYDENIASMLDQDDTLHDNNVIAAGVIAADVIVAEIEADETSSVDAVFLLFSLLSSCVSYMM